MTDVIRPPDMSDDEIGTLNLLLAQLEAREPRNYLRACYYDGKRAMRQVGTIIPPRYYQLGLVLGWSAKAVDILSRRCNLDRFIWPDGDLDSLGAREVWDSNYLGHEISSGMTSSLIHATSFLINTRGDEADGEPKSLIHTRDARSATGEWNNRTRSLRNLLSIHGRDKDGKVSEFGLYLPNLTITSKREDGQWTTTRLEHTLGVPAEALTYKRRDGRPFGSSRISRAVMSLHDGALRTVLRMEGHADVYSFPEMVMLGADMSVFTDDEGNKLPEWQVMLGRWKGIPDDDDAAQPRADVKQFPAQSPEPHIAQLKQQAQLFSGETSIPLTSLGVSDMSNPSSADSYIASREDLISEAEGATDDWSPALRRTFARALAIQNDLTEVPREWLTIDTKFRPPIYQSRAAAADAGTKQLAAVPWLAETEIGLELLGLDDQQIKRAMSERRRQGGTAALATILERAAAQQVGAAGAEPEVDGGNTGEPAP